MMRILLLLSVFATVHSFWPGFGRGLNPSLPSDEIEKTASYMTKPGSCLSAKSFTLQKCEYEVIWSVCSATCGGGWQVGHTRLKKLGSFKQITWPSEFQKDEWVEGSETNPRTGKLLFKNVPTTHGCESNSKEVPKLCVSGYPQGHGNFKPDQTCASPELKESQPEYELPYDEVTSPFTRPDTLRRKREISMWDWPQCYRGVPEYGLDATDLTKDDELTKGFQDNSHLYRECNVQECSSDAFGAKMDKFVAELNGILSESSMPSMRVCSAV